MPTAADFRAAFLFERNVYMCTAATYKTNDFYFGRTLDYEFSYGDSVTVTPRNYVFNFRNGEVLKSHYAIIGMAFVYENYPLYYDGINEKGLGIAGLNFVGNAVYNKSKDGENNTPQFELIPKILAKCATVDEAINLINSINITDTPYNETLPVAALHWIIADKNKAVTVECTATGTHIHNNPVGLLTNNPPFETQMFLLNNYMNLSAAQPKNTFAPDLDLNLYSRGMGAMGLPGDLSSSSRFIRAAFTKMNSKSGDSEEESVSQFFHILGSVDQQRGCCEVAPNKYEITIYTSCCNTTKGIYYYTTYNNSAVTAVDLHAEDLNGSELAAYPLNDKMQIFYQNK